MTATETLQSLIERADAIYHDVALARVAAWKAAEPGRRAIGYLPGFAPLEMITAAGMLPVGIVGGGDQVEIIRGDAYFQSYICHLPRSVVELGVSGRLDACDGFLFPSTCDVIRNLSGVWQLLFPDKLVHYVDVPQDFSTARGGAWWRHELATIRDRLGALRGRPIADDEIWKAIRDHDEQRAASEDLRALRSAQPWRVPTEELYVLERAGLAMPAAEHARFLRSYLDAVAGVDRPQRDRARVVISGAFCEQPPLELLKTLERAGCWVVDDDLLIGPRMLKGAVMPEGGPEGDPVDALVGAFLEKRAPAAFILTEGADQGRHLVASARCHRAEGVIFAAPSFCDPALLDRPMLARALADAGISHTSFKYAENTGQFQGIREQAGTFADSLKLWGEA